MSIDLLDMTDAARERWLSINRNASDAVALALYEVMPDGGFTFGVSVHGGHWHEFAVDPDGGAYPLDL